MEEGLTKCNMRLVKRLARHRGTEDTTEAEVKKRWEEKSKVKNKITKSRKKEIKIMIGHHRYKQQLAAKSCFIHDENVDYYYLKKKKHTEPNVEGKRQV